MAATFDASLPTAKDRLRFRLGDTVTTAPAGQDETYAAFLTLYGDDEQKAAVALASGFVARYAQEPDVVDLDGVVKVSWKDRLPTWRAIAAEAQATVDAAAGVGGLVTVSPTRRGSRSEYRAYDRTLERDY